MEDVRCHVSRVRCHKGNHVLNSARNTVQANNVRCHELFVNRVATNWLLRKVISSNAIETVEDYSMRGVTGTFSDYTNSVNKTGS